MILQSKTEPIYKCRNLRGNLDRNLFSEIIQISLTASWSDAAAQGGSRGHQQRGILLIEHILWITIFITFINTYIHTYMPCLIVVAHLNAHPLCSAVLAFFYIYICIYIYFTTLPASNNIKTTEDSGVARAEISPCEGDSTCAYTLSVPGAQSTTESKLGSGLRQAASARRPAV